MERSVSVDEKIRRAEQIYNRRNRVNEKRTATVNVATPKNKIKFKKMIIQIFICILIYTIYYLITTTNYVFSADVINKTKEILNQDINFIEIYNNLINLNNSKEEEEIIKETTIQEPKDTTGNSSLQENEVENTNILSEKSTDTLEGEAIIEENVVTEENTLSASDENSLVEESSSFNQMDIDANEIKSGYSLIKPLSGTITSRYGIRNPTTETVPKYHTGIDIAANEGSEIIAAMDGTVSLVSSEGDYRKSYKNIK